MVHRKSGSYAKGPVFWRSGKKAGDTHVGHVLGEPKRQTVYKDRVLDWENLGKGL